MKSDLKAFASDNFASVHPEVMQALVDCNHNHSEAYGDDIYTARAQELFKAHFGDEVESYIVFSGTGANILSLDCATKPIQSIICPRSAHINEDECGAIEKITGSRLVPIDTDNGKLTPGLVSPHLKGFGFIHHAQPGVISISQSTEYGTLYSLEEIAALSDLAHKHGMYLHVDGARICNAAAALNCSLKELTTDLGVDVLSFGGTKNGLMYGEAAIFINPKLAEYAAYYRKQNGQLPSKQRYPAAQFIALLQGDLWLQNAKHANAMAKRLKDGIANLNAINITQSAQANVVFAKIPKDAIEKLQQHTFFYVWDDKTSEVRLMTSFDTTQVEVDRFIEVLKQI